MTDTDGFAAIGGGELLALLQSKPGCRMDEVEANHFFKQIVAGVQYCHRFHTLLFRLIRVIRVIDDPHSSHVKFP